MPLEIAIAYVPLNFLLVCFTHLPVALTWQVGNEYLMRCSIRLTFDVDLDVVGLAHAELIFSCARIEAGRVASDRAECDLDLRAEDAGQPFFAPQNGGWRICVHDTSQSGRILFIFKVVQG